MSDGSWVKGFPAEVTVCDAQGRILEMNDRSVAQFVKYGGKELIGKNLLDCHPRASPRHALGNAPGPAEQLLHHREGRGSRG